jgi:hypothetical protein
MFKKHERSVKLNINFSRSYDSANQTKGVEAGFIRLVWWKEVPVNLSGNYIGAPAKGTQSRLQRKGSSTNLAPDPSKS